MKFLNFLSVVSKRYPALARTLEVVVLGSFFDALIAICTLIQTRLTAGSTRDYKMLVFLFLSTLGAGIAAGATKWLRDQKKKIDPESL